MAATQLQSVTNFTTPSSPLPMSGLASFLNNIFSWVGILMASVSGINFGSANTDYVVNISLPAGFTRYLISSVSISGASADISAATCGLFTATGGGGTAIVASGSAITVSATADATNNNAMSFALTDQNTRSYTVTALYFRVQSAASGTPTASVTVRYIPLP
jgi:hypothetical protein